MRYNALCAQWVALRDKSRVEKRFIGQGWEFFELLNALVDCFLLRVYSHSGLPLVQRVFGGPSVFLHRWRYPLVEDFQFDGVRICRRRGDEVLIADSTHEEYTNSRSDIPVHPVVSSSAFSFPAVLKWIFEDHKLKN